LCFSLAGVDFFFLLIKIRVSEEDYVEAIKKEINKVVKLQEELDIDVLVHGEPEVSSPQNKIA
jgi:hypothetical protein